MASATLPKYHARRIAFETQIVVARAQPSLADRDADSTNAHVHPRARICGSPVHGDPKRCLDQPATFAIRKAIRIEETVATIPGSMKL